MVKPILCFGNDGGGEQPETLRCLGATCGHLTSSPHLDLCLPSFHRVVDVFFESPNDVRDTGSIWSTAEKRHNAVGIFWPMIGSMCRPAGFLSSLFIRLPSHGLWQFTTFLFRKRRNSGQVPLDDSGTRADFKLVVGLFPFGLSLHRLWPRG
jgi:hypothetical protein